jgi:hypothetical protein
MRADHPGGHAAIIKDELGAGYSLLRVARWEEGIAFAPGLSLPSIRAAVRSNLHWIGREDGSGARQCLDELLIGRKAPKRLASDHRGVAEAVRNGWADSLRERMQPKPLSRSERRQRGVLLDALRTRRGLLPQDDFSTQRTR